MDINRQKLKSALEKTINWFINYSQHRRKVFCIGLHKTGTSTIAHYVGRHGVLFTHSTDWHLSRWKLRFYRFFADGGSHFDDIDEFDFEHLYHTYPDSLFILQTRDDVKWLISKMKHLGWNEETVIMPDDPSRIESNDATHKSMLVLKKFVEHKHNYERKVRAFFEAHDPSRLLCMDVTDKRQIDAEMLRLREFMKLKSMRPVKIPHKNKNLRKTKLSDRYMKLAAEVVDSVRQETGAYSDLDNTRIAAGAK
jgi:hypothetical protein